MNTVPFFKLEACTNWGQFAPTWAAPPSLVPPGNLSPCLDTVDIRWHLFVNVWFKLLHCCFPGFGKLFLSDSLSAASPNFRAFSFVDLEAWSWSFQPIHSPACCEAWCSSSDTQHPQLQLPDSERESRSSGQKLEVAHSCLGCIFERRLDIWMWKKRHHNSIMTFVFREFGSPVGAQSLSWCDILQQLPETAFQTRWRCTAWLRNLMLASMLQNNEPPANRASKTPGLLQAPFSPISSWFSPILTFWKYWCAAQVLIPLKNLLTAAPCRCPQNPEKTGAIWKDIKGELPAGWIKQSFRTAWQSLSNCITSVSLTMVLNKTSAGAVQSYNVPWESCYGGVHLLEHVIKEFPTSVKSMQQPSDVMKRTVLTCSNVMRSQNNPAKPISLFGECRGWCKSSTERCKPLSILDPQLVLNCLAAELQTLQSFGKVFQQLHCLCESDHRLNKTSVGAVQSYNIPWESSYGVSIFFGMRVKSQEYATHEENSCHAACWKHPFEKMHLE